MTETFVTVDNGEESPTQPPEAEAEAQRPLYFANVEDWLTNWALPHYRRNPALHTWDPKWWQYEEAGTVLEALWESWEQVRWEDAMSTVAWFRDYFYPIMDRITDPQDGTFWAYDPPRETEPPAGFETELAPTGWFTTISEG